MAMLCVPRGLSYPCGIQNITFLAMTIVILPPPSIRYWDNAVGVVAYRMTSTNTSGLFGRVGVFNVERKTFSAYIERMEMYFFTANNIVETTGEGSAAASNSMTTDELSQCHKQTVSQLKTIFNGHSNI